MHVTGRNVNDIFHRLVTGFHHRLYPLVEEGSRNGPVMRITEPMIITYKNPRERVLLNNNRDANPFFHVYEALWMLAGRNDLKPLQYYVSTFDQFSDDGRTLNGAYGYRWRHNLWYDGLGSYNRSLDQLDILIKHLKSKPDSRRAVLQMWDVKYDLAKIDSSKDVCCNTCVYFSLREEPTDNVDFTGIKYLDMTVCNRSNDLILGMLGANVVHFSFLQEYMADCIGHDVEVGVYNQITNNLHVYKNNWHPEKWLAENTRRPPDYYPPLRSRPLVEDKERFDEEVSLFVDNFYGLDSNRDLRFKEPWLEDIAKPMCRAFYFHKQRSYPTAIMEVNRVQSLDWRVAGEAWLRKRWDRYNAKEEGKIK